MRRNAIVGLLILIVFGLILYWPVLIRGRVFFWHDVSIAYMPLRMLAQQAISQGHLPVWTPQLGCGFPLLAEGQAGVFYPLHLIGYLGLPYYHTYSLMVYLHCLLGAIFAALLMRRLKLGWAAATLTGLAYGFSGFFISKVLFITVLETGAWLPLILYLLLGGLESGDWRYFLGGAMAFAVCILGGHPQIVFYSLLAIGSLMVAYLVAERRLAPGRKWGRSVAAMVLIVGLGASLAAVQLLPTTALAKFAERRTEVTPRYLRELGLSARSLVYFVHPYILGSYAENNYFGRDHYYEVCGYVGGITLILALVGLSSAGRGCKYRWYFAFLVGFGLFMALAKYNPLYELLPNMPGFNLFRAPGRYLMLSTLGLAMLGGAGLHSLAGSQGTRQAHRLALWCLLTVLAAASLMIMLDIGQAPLSKRLAQQMPSTEGPRRIPLTDAQLHQKAQVKYQFFRQRLSLADPVWRAFVIGTAAVGLAAWLVGAGVVGYQAAAVVTIGVLSWQLLAFGLPYNGTAPASFFTEIPRVAQIIRANPRPGRQYTDPRLNLQESVYYVNFTPPEYRGWLDGDVEPYFRAREILQPNSAVLYGVTAAEGHRYALLPRRQYEILEEIVPEKLAAADSAGGGIQLLRMLNVEYLISVPELDSPELVALVREAEYCLYRLSNPMPPVWLAKGIVACNNGQEALSLVTSPRFDPERTTTVEGAPAGLGDREATGAANLVNIGGATMTIQVEIREDTLVVISMAYNPNLVARIDDNEVAIYRTNYVLCGIPVPAGDHTVTIEYKSEPLRLGVIISLIAVVLTGLLYVAASTSLRRRESTNAAKDIHCLPDV